VNGKGKRETTKGEEIFLTANAFAIAANNIKEVCKSE